jgi:predicted transcriptional regulator
MANSPTQQQVCTLIDDMRYRLDELESAAKGMIPEKTWYNRAEFAKKTGLTRRTVSNYLQRRRFGDKQRKKNGHWQIHKSALNKY